MPYYSAILSSSLLCFVNCVSASLVAVAEPFEADRDSAAAGLAGVPARPTKAYASWKASHSCNSSSSGTSLPAVHIVDSIMTSPTRICCIGAGYVGGQRPPDRTPVSEVEAFRNVQSM